MKIVTNNVPRPLVYGFDLTPKEKAEFDYLEDIDSANFFHYKGQVYDIGEFSRIIPPGANRCHPTECDNPDFTGWHGYSCDSFFSGVLLKWHGDNYDSVIVGQYFC